MTYELMDELGRTVFAENIFNNSDYEVIKTGKRYLVWINSENKVYYLHKCYKEEPL